MKKQTININQYISEARNVLVDILKSGRNTVVLGPTGSGKTRAFLEVAKNIVKDNSKQAIVFATPNKSQSEQNSLDYGVTAIVGGVNIHDISSKDKKVCSVVYDKVADLVGNLRGASFDVTLIVDEAHELIDSYSYRKKSIELIITIMEDCKNIIYLSATPDIILDNPEIFPYEQVIEFQINSRKPNACEFEIIEYENNLKDIVLDTLIKERKEHKVGICRLNDKGMLNDLKYSLNINGIEAEVLTSENKANSPAYSSITSSSTLPDDLQILEVTSLIDSEINIKNAEDSFCIFVCKANEFSFTAIEQFSNRFRNQYKKFILIKKKNINIHSNNLDIREKNTLEFFQVVLNWVNSKEKDYANAEAKLAAMRAMINAGGLGNPANGFVPYVYIDEDNFKIRIDKYLKASYIQHLQHMREANDINNVKRRLKNISRNVEVRKYDKDEAKKEKSLEAKEIAKIEKEMKRDEYIKITENLKKMLEFSKGITGKKRDNFAKNLIFVVKKPTDARYIKIFKLIANDLEQIAQNIDESVDSSIIEDFLDKVYNMFKLSIQYFDIVDRVSETCKQSELAKLQKEVEYIGLNIQFKDSLEGIDAGFNLSVDLREYAIIRNILDVYIQKRIKKELLDYIQDQLSTKDGDENIIKKYSLKSLNSKISLIYNITDIRKNDFKISSLKIKLDKYQNPD